LFVTFFFSLLLYFLFSVSYEQTKTRHLNEELKTRNLLFLLIYTFTIRKKRDEAKSVCSY